jgi:hypothetical protein
MLAEGALKCGAAVHRFGCVISHIFIVVLPPVRGFGQEVCDLRAGNALLARRAAGQYLGCAQDEPVAPGRQNKMGSKSRASVRLRLRVSSHWYRRGATTFTQSA